MKPAVVVACVLLLEPWGQQTSRDMNTIEAGLRSADPGARAAAACAARQLGSDAAAAMPRLLDLLSDGSPVDPAVCGERTWRRWGSDDVTTPGEQAASALVAIGTPSFDGLAAALKSAAWIARRNAAWALGALDDGRASPMLNAALRDTEPAVREQSAWASGALQDRGSVTALIGALADSDARVRAQSAWALGAIGDRAATDALTNSLKDPDPRVRRQAAWALGAIR